MQATPAAREPFAMDVNGAMGDSLHPLLREAAEAGPLAEDPVTGGVYVLRHHDVEQLAHEPRLAGIGLALFDLMGISDNVMLYRDDVPNVEVGVEVDRAFDAAGEVVPSHLPSGLAAVTVHCGPRTPPVEPAASPWPY